MNMIAKILKRFYWTVTILIAVLLIYALVTKDFMVLTGVWIVLWMSLSLWYYNRSRLKRITDRWRKRQNRQNQNESNSEKADQ